MTRLYFVSYAHNEGFGNVTVELVSGNFDYLEVEERIRKEQADSSALILFWKEIE